MAGQGIPTFHKMCSNYPGQVLCAGSFRPNGATGIVSGSTKGNGFSVARTSAGLYTVTFDAAHSFPDKVAVLAGVRAADATPTIVQAGDYSEANRTLQLRVLQAATAGVTEGAGRIPIPLDKLVEFPSIKNLPLTDLVADPANPPVAVTTGFTIGWGFDADAEQIGVSFRVPDDWDGASDLTLRLVWHPQSGTAIGNTETVIWKFTYHVVNKAGEACDNGTQVAGSVTYTQSGAGTDKEVIDSEIALDYDNANQPILPGDTVTGKVHIDFTTMTYAADVVLMHLELQYNSSEPGRVGPRLVRENGTTDPAMKLVWPAGDVSTLQLLSGVPLPPDMGAAGSVTLHLFAKMSSTNDTPVVSVDAYVGTGDTKVEGDTGALSDSLAEVTATLTAADIDTPPNVLNLDLTPGAHATDDLEVYGAWIEYTLADFATTGQVFSLADMAADVDAEVSFAVVVDNELVGS